MFDIAPYRKTVSALYTGLVTWAYTALADGHVDTLEWVGLAGVVGIGLGVYQAVNEDVLGPFFRVKPKA